MGWYGKERVDYITFDTNGIWRCYEVKVSKSDFHSKAKNTFIGHFNYYVMPLELFEQVKNEIPNHIGVYADGNKCIKKPKKQILGINENILKDSMIRSLYREVEKQIRSNTPTTVDYLNRQVRQFEKQYNEYKDKYWDLLSRVREKYGARWEK